MRTCVDCGREAKIFSKDRCQYCAGKAYAKAAQEKRKENEQIKRNTVKQKASEKEHKSLLKKYFEDHIKRLDNSPYSEESGKYISIPSRMNVCHLIDKSRHPSVACHPMNFVYLTWQEHTRFDQLLFAHRFGDLKEEFPKIWPTVIERLREVLEHCTENTKMTRALKELTKL